MTERSDAYKGESKTNKVLKTAGLTLAAAMIFLFGFGMGNGSVSFGASTPEANKSLSSDLNYASVEQIYDLLRNNYDGKLDEAKLIDGLKAGLAKATGDPYTTYFNTEEAQKFEDQLQGAFTGIGAELGKDDNGSLMIVAPIEGSPASKAGIRSKDIIVSVDGASTVDMSIEEAIRRIRGPKDTEVTLRIVRNKSEDLSFKIVRDEIKIPSVKWEMVDSKIGKISISQFGMETYDLMLQAADELKDKGATKILLDLRDNPGGELNSSIDIASLWLPAGKTILQEKRGGIVTKTHISKTEGDPVFKDMPTVVLINEGSASASEIVAGALHDNNVATLYGQKSYGKGSVQEIHKLPRGAEIKITVARWYTPAGQNIDKKGIKPDKEVKISDEDYENKKDPQKDAALEFLRTK
ncbi:MAG TPA: S41 family peptidase [Candidatus Saccharimonadales bacterium]